MGRANRRQAPRHQQTDRSWLVFLVAGAVLLVGALFVVLRNSGGSAQALPTNQASGPQLAIDQTEQDLGNFALNQPAHSEFVVKNVGGQPLRILDQPKVEALKGC